MYFKLHCRARSISIGPITGPEPVLGLPYSVVKRAIGDWMERKHIECWMSDKDCKHSKALVEGPQQSSAIKLLNMSRQQLSVVIGLLTGHLDLNGHLHKIGVYKSFMQKVSQLQ